jgi:hypothetical protein
MKREYHNGNHKTVLLQLGQIRRLSELEVELVDNLNHWRKSSDPAKRRRIRQDNFDIVADGVAHICGFDKKTHVSRVSRELGCCELLGVSRWGSDRYEHNTLYTLANHVAMVRDRPRVKAFAHALRQDADGRRVLDVGSGPFCLLSRMALRAGARSVDCVEQNEWAVEHAIDVFLDEADNMECKDMMHANASMIQRGVRLSVRTHRPREGKARLSVEMGHDQKLQLFQGFSSKAPLAGKYDLVVHEILGHIASAEGAVGAIQDLRRRSLLTPDCKFIPSTAMTMFMPTEQIEFSCLERILQMHSSGYESDIRCRTKYHALRFPARAALAEPALFEYLDFGGDLQDRQRRWTEFYTLRDGIFDGIHFYMVADLGGEYTINTMLQQTSWRTTYVRVLDPGIFLVAGSRIVCKTLVELDRPDPMYSIEVLLGEKGAEESVAQFSWSGCS